MTKIRADEDSPWKLLLRLYFREAIEFFFPTIDRINKLSLTRLESLGEALLDFSAIADLTIWLDRLD